MLLFDLLRAPIGSRLVRTDFDGSTLTLGIATAHPNAFCPACGGESQRVHSRYTRHLAEEPAFGHQVRLQMYVRRFLCPDAECPRQIFVERLGGLAVRHARTTTRRAQAHLTIGLALGGEAGARLAEKPAMPTSPDTLLRRVKQAGARSSSSPRLVGIDDWAWLKGPKPTIEPNRQETPLRPTPASARHEVALAKRQRRVERFERVYELHR